MRIIIPIKQVPETSHVEMDETTGTMIRRGVESIINPLDLYALETGLRLKEEKGGEIIVLSMGPKGAEKGLREALSMGCDEAFLICSQEFAGSDTWATSLVLSKAIEKIGEYDLILTGERATDGDTGQVGPGVASLLALPLATYTSKIIAIKDYNILVERLIETGYEILSLQLPALLTVIKEISYPRLPTLRGKQKARRREITSWKGEDLGLREDQIGLQGSPTKVVQIRRPKIKRTGTVIMAQDQVDEAVRELLLFLKEKGILGGGRDGR